MIQTQDLPYKLGELAASLGFKPTEEFDMKLCKKR
jgi:hypothetical protein